MDYTTDHVAVSAATITFLSLDSGTLVATVNQADITYSLTVTNRRRTELDLIVEGRTACGYSASLRVGGYYG